MKFVCDCQILQYMVDRNQQQQPEKVQEGEEEQTGEGQQAVVVNEEAEGEQAEAVNEIQRLFAIPPLTANTCAARARARARTRACPAAAFVSPVPNIVSYSTVICACEKGGMEGLRTALHLLRTMQVQGRYKAGTRQVQGRHKAGTRQVQGRLC